jgi:hypothetical protein
VADYLKIQIPKGSRTAQRIDTLLTYGGYKSAAEITTAAVELLYKRFLADDAANPPPDEATEHLIRFAIPAQIACVDTPRVDDDDDSDDEPSGKVKDREIAARQSDRD